MYWTNNWSNMKHKHIEINMLCLPIMTSAIYQPHLLKAFSCVWGWLMAWLKITIGVYNVMDVSETYLYIIIPPPWCPRNVTDLPNIRSKLIQYFWNEIQKEELTMNTQTAAYYVKRVTLKIKQIELHWIQIAKPPSASKSDELWLLWGFYFLLGKSKHWTKLSVNFRQ